jgi:pimeloyl-ACP methyl ester carboxylesterase
MLHSRPTKLLLAAIIGLAPVQLRQVAAGEVKLKNGMVLHGTPSDIESLLVGPHKADRGPITLYPIVMVSTPLKRYFVPTRQKETVNREVDLSQNEGFKLPQHKRPGGGRIIASVQGLVEKPRPFDEWGRRTVKLKMESGETAVIQGVTQITPEFLKIIALNFNWETAMATRSVPPESLDAMLRRVTDAKNPDDRLKIARFYIQAANYEGARRELVAIRETFPELAATVDQVQITLTQALAQEALNELKLRRAAGQHRFVYEFSKRFPSANVAAPILREAHDIAVEYERAFDRAERARALLGELQGELVVDSRVREVAPLRAELCERLTYSSIDRLDAFFKLAADAQLRPAEKLALALSGWVVGSEHAVTEIDQALRFWQARYLILDYLRTDPDAQVERKSILEKLAALESAGPERIAQILALLPAALEAPAITEGEPVRIQAAGAQEPDRPAYWISLPLEYHADHSYPVIVALHSETGTPQQELKGFWGGGGEKGGQSERHGFIVIAPEYVPKSDLKVYDYGSQSHQIVLDSLRDARLRFNVNSDRVFLAGHGMGGDAAWDMGLAHPQEFAGVIPINGAIDRYSKYYLENGRQLPFYAVNGELDRDLVTRNGAPLMEMMQQNFDLIYAEYDGAGPESYHSEIPALFEWMSKLRRPAPPRQISAKTLRETDNRFFWYEFSGLPEQFRGIDWVKEKHRAIRAMAVSATITPGNTLRVTSGAAHHRLWLARGEGQVDFEKRLKVDVNGRMRFNDFVKPDLEAMLEHVRLTGDRQQLYWALLDF